MKLLPTLTVCLLVIHQTICDKSDIGLDTAQMIENHGYVSETHQITTEDGYVLTIHRIPHGINDNSTTKKPAVLLMHGLTVSSADYVVMGPGRSLGYILADAGYDVWLTNARGNAFSRKHITLDPDVDSAKFYNFSWHEIGYYDLAQTIDYILDLNGDDSLYYIGHSQGTTAFLVLAATRPEYNQKVRLATLMAAAGIVKHVPNLLIQELSKYVDKVEVILKNWNIFEIPYLKEIRNFVSTTCVDPSSNELCEALFNLQFGGDITQADEEFLPVIYTNFPSNSAMKAFVHYAQLVRDGGFRYYNYGSERNLELYGSEVPPDYDLSKVLTPIAIYYGKNDALIAVEDEQALLSMIPNVANDYLVPHDLFTHNDFLYAKDVVTLVYNELLSVMEKY